MATRQEWARGYARQAHADFTLFQLLESLSNTNRVEPCHKLHFLQMACEKLVKAHLCGEGSDPSALQSSHAYVAGTLPIVLRQTAASLSFTGRRAQWVLQHAKQLAHEIELLAPSVKRGGGRPDNCEYPWEDQHGTLHVPVDWTFVPSQLLLVPAGRTVLKLITVAIDQLLEILPPRVAT